MKPYDSDSAYDAWLARRREDFRSTDLSFLVMNELRSERAKHRARWAWPTSYLGVPSTLLGTARIALFFFLILIPT